MEAIVLYFNELCLEGGPTAIDQDHRWTSAVAGLAHAIDDLLTIRSDGTVAFPSGSLHADCGGRPLCVRFQQCLPKTKYLRLLARFRQLSHENIALEREVRFSGCEAVGLTLADIAAHEWSHGWAVSLALSNSPWLHHTVSAQRFVLNDLGNLDGPTECIVSHLSSGDHVQRWQAQILDWGASIAQSCELAVVDGHPIVMYPSPHEHGPPHVHLLESRGSRGTLAKYRIDKFERPKGRPDWDAEMRTWITVHREQLLRSWDRCQRGGHPYEIT